MSRSQSYSFFIRKILFNPSVRTQSLFARGSLDSYILYDLFLYTPKIFLFWWMVDGLHFNYDGTEIERMFLDIITNAAGRLRDCVHKSCAEGLRGKQSIQKNLKLGRPRQPITHKI